MMFNVTDKLLATFKTSKHCIIKLWDFNYVFFELPLKKPLKKLEPDVQKC